MYKSATVRVTGMCAEDVFELMDALVVQHGGDGCAALFCDNPHEVAEWFADWKNDKYKRWNANFCFEGLMDKHEHKDGAGVTWHDSNENYIFRNTDNIILFSDDYFIYVDEDAKEAEAVFDIVEEGYGQRIIKAFGGTK